MLGVQSNNDPDTDRLSSICGPWLCPAKAIIVVHWKYWFIIIWYSHVRLGLLAYLINSVLTFHSCLQGNEIEYRNIGKVRF